MKERKGVAVEEEAKRSIRKPEPGLSGNLCVCIIGGKENIQRSVII